MEKASIFLDGNGAGAVQRGVESAGDTLHHGIDKMADPARHAIDSLSSTAHETVDKLATSAGHTASRFAEQTHRLTEAPGKAVDYSTSMIQSRPLEAVGIALAVGFVLGRLTAR
jgi:ElaB/YqjD/DUF883 family membrane-anchored ribosome-binding protein